MEGEEMTDEEINIAIAEACRWKPTADAGICWGPSGEEIITPPSYCRDLNAMHEAEDFLRKGFGGASRIQSYRGKLNGITKYPQHATARQRAEAFLRTIGKWKEAVMSDTPNVDEAEWRVTWHAKRQKYMVTIPNFDGGYVVHSSKARQLERKLNESYAINEELSKRLQWYVDNDDTYADDDNGFWATGNKLAVSALAKFKESRNPEIERGNK
jgi:hypothetical protein